MNRTFYLKKENAAPKWRVIDAKGKIVGRLATKIATMLRGKDRAIYTPHTLSNDYIVVINAEKVKFTGDKLENKIYERYSGYQGGYKTITPKTILASAHPERIIEHAVKLMLPKNKSQKHFMKRLKIYAGDKHPHDAQF